MSKTLEHKISRRGFLKTTGQGLAALNAATVITRSGGALECIGGDHGKRWGRKRSGGRHRGAAGT